MIKTKLSADLWSAMKICIMLARRHDLVVIIRESNFFRCVYSSHLNLDSVNELKSFDTVLTLVRGKPTKSTLTDSERAYFVELARESNANLN